MDGRTLKKQLRQVTIAVTAAIAVILLIGGSLLVNLFDSLETAAENQIKSETEEYSQRIYRKLNQDVSWLNTVAAMIGAQNTLDDSNITAMIDGANHTDRFISLGFFPLSGKGIYAEEISGNSALYKISLTSMEKEVERVVCQAMEGQEVISDIYRSYHANDEMLTFSVPVYMDGQIVGALGGCKDTESLTRILNEETVLNGGGYLDLLDSEGKILIQSDSTVIPHRIYSIYDGQYLEQGEGNEQGIREAMSAQEPIFSSFAYEGEEYLIYLEPIGINGWYICCIDTRESTLMPAQQVIAIMLTAMAGILAIIAIFCILGYGMVRRKCHNLLKAAYFDPITGAENYSAFLQHIQEEAGQLDDAYIVAINIHQFKFVNELFGQKQADRLLWEVKQILDRSLREGEYFCRENGDQFCILMREQSPETVSSRVKGIMKRIGRVSVLEKSNYQVMLYAGAVAGSDRQAMLHVMFALKKAQKSEYNKIVFFDEKLHEAEETNNYITTHMFQALEDQEFKLYLQPKIDFSTGRIGGAEALVRWQTSDGTVLSPDQFVPLFEQNGFCSRLDMYMVEKVCQWIRGRMDAGLPAVPVSVNQTKLLFYETEYVRELCGLIETYGIPAELITLEILEGLAVSRVEELNRQIRRLKEKGFRISMDDFGSGYSSLNTLYSIEIDELKLDQVFLTHSSKKQDFRRNKILKYTIQMAKSLHIVTVAEGVETEEDHLMIRSLGCDYGQGYYYSPPVSAEEFNRSLI